MNLNTLGPHRKLRGVREKLEKLSFKRISVRPLSPTIGAELGDVDLRKPLDDETFAEVHRALLEFKVIFFRNQKISTAEHVAFARRFGELEIHPFLPSNTDFSELVRFAKDEKTIGVENLWHSDVSWRLEPSLGSILRAIETPNVGGDTLFCDMVAAYDSLSDELKKEVEGLNAIHDFTHSFGIAMDPETLAQKRKEFPPARHPIVRTHPDTGEKILYVNGIFTSHIEDMERDASDALLETLCRQSACPEFQCRFHWERDSIAFWDNRATWHYALNDYHGQSRRMHRITIEGGPLR